MLRSKSAPTAIFASNDDTAAAAISVARRLGLKLPEQLSVVGFDDAPVATMIWPQLTTIRQPVTAMARTATDLIIEHSPRRNGWPSPVPRRLLEFELILRNSTAPPAVDRSRRIPRTLTRYRATLPERAASLPRRVFRGVLYDLDGTLLDTAADIMLALNRMLAEYGWDAMNESEVRRMIGRGGQVLVERTAEAQQRVLEPAELTAMVDRFYHHYGLLEQTARGGRAAVSGCRRWHPATCMRPGCAARS